MHSTESDGPSVSYIVPARNEAGTIQKIVDQLPSFGKMTEIVFIENGSRDNTLAEIERVVREYHGSKVIRHTSMVSRGKVEAVMRGFEMATGDICIIYDADMTVPSEEVVPFYEKLRSTNGVLVNGTRLLHEMEKDAMRSLNFAGNKMYARIMSFLFKVRLTDTLCGTKAIWKSDYERIKRTHARFYGLDPFCDFDLLIGAHLSGMQILEVPVHYKSRVYGRTNIRRIKNGWNLFVILFLLALEKMRPSGTKQRV